MKKNYSVWTIFVTAILFCQYSYSFITADILRQNISIAESPERQGVSVTAMEIRSKTLTFFVDNPKSAASSRTLTIYFKNSEQMGSFLQVLSKDGKILVPKGTMRGTLIDDAIFVTFDKFSFHGEEVCKISFLHSGGVEIGVCQ